MAGEGDAERLVVLLEARIRDFEKNMAKASGTATTNYGRMRRDSKTATERMEADMMRSTSSINRALSATSTRIGTFGKTMVAGFAGGLVAGGIAGIVTRLGQVASGVAAIGDEARRAGVDIKSFQELQYVAEQNRISVSALTDGMKELNLRADEWIVTGGGAAAEAFTRLGYTAEELNTKLQDPSALLSEIIGKVQDMDRAAQIRIFDELFGGTGGEQFVQLIAQGEEGIRRTIDEANALGIVIDADIIAKAAEVDRKFNQIANTVGSAVRGAIVDATHALLDFINAQNEAIRRNRMMAMDADATAKYDETIASVEAMLDAVGRAFPEAEARVRDLATAVIEGQMAAEDAKTALLAMAVNPDMSPVIGEINGLLGVLELLIGRTQTARAELAALDPVGAGATWEGMRNFANPAKPRPTTKPGSGSTGRGASISEAEREAKAVQNLIAGLEFERSLIGLSAVEQAKMNALRQAGTAATKEQRQQISALVEANIIEQQNVDYLTGMYDMLGQAGMGAVQGIIDAMADGKIEASEFGAILSDVLGMAGQFFLNAAFKGMGTAFGFSEGGYTGPGGKHQPAGVVHKGEVVWSQRDIQKAGGVGTVEAMRRGVRGYADGGIVQAYTPPAAAAVQNHNNNSETIAPQLNITINAPGATKDAAPEIARVALSTLRQNFHKMMNDYQRNPLRIPSLGGR